MKRRILVIVLCLICLLGLTACTDISETSASTSKYANLKVIETTSDGKVLMDVDTGCLYLQYTYNGKSYGLTPLYNADGSIKNITNFEN